MMVDEPYSSLNYIDEAFRYSYSLIYKKMSEIEDSYFLVGAIAVSDSRDDHAILEFINDDPEVTDFMINVFVVNVDLLTEDWLAQLAMKKSHNDVILVTEPLLIREKSADAIVAKLHKIAVERDYIVKDERIKEFIEI